MRLLIVGCSQTKRQGEHDLTALQRYDGPVFRMLRNRVVRMPVFVLSAEFGLIPIDQRVDWYDRRMDAERARELGPQVRASLKSVLQLTPPTEILCVLGRHYRACLGDDYGLPMRFAEGPIGMKLHQLKLWLEEPQ